MTISRQAVVLSKTQMDTSQPPHSPDGHSMEISQFVQGPSMISALVQVFKIDPALVRVLKIDPVTASGCR